MRIQPNSVRNGVSTNRRTRAFAPRFGSMPVFFRVFFVFVLVMMVVAGIYAFSSRNDFIDSCASTGGTASQQYSYSAGQWVQFCKNSDGAITDFR